jgi:hypothetical protein
MPNGGYVVDNGISVCDDCHLQAEQYLIDQSNDFTPGKLYEIIGSSKEKAEESSGKLK